VLAGDLCEFCFCLGWVWGTLAGQEVDRRRPLVVVSKDVGLPGRVQHHAVARPGDSRDVGCHAPVVVPGAASGEIVVVQPLDAARKQYPQAQDQPDPLPQRRPPEGRKPAPKGLP